MDRKLYLMGNKALLHRQIHPTFVVNNIVSNQAFLENNLIISSGAFTPTIKDEDKLSVYDGTIFSAKDSHEHFIANHSSCGVLSLSIDEINSENPLFVEMDNEPFEGHCSINFSSVISRNQKTKKAGKLRDFAVKRNWTYKP